MAKKLAPLNTMQSRKWFSSLARGKECKEGKDTLLVELYGKRAWPVAPCGRTRVAPHRSRP